MAAVAHRLRRGGAGGQRSARAGVGPRGGAGRARRQCPDRARTILLQIATNDRPLLDRLLEPLLRGLPHRPRN